MKDGSYLKNVRDQYEDYPYPARNPLTEKGMLYVSKSSSLDCLNHYCFEGKRDFSDNFRVLAAGGGTGDCAIYLAEQLRETKAEVVYLDMSEASMKIAQERAKVRQLDNITWVNDSILNLPNLGLGEFDYITCTGVLHHLAEPKEGLDALKSVLHPEGSMYIMVYAQIGRTGIYQMQEMLRQINKSVESIEEKITNTKKILATLPKTNWFNFNAAASTLDLSSDIGIYDLLLHTQDRAYTVSEMYDFVEESGLTLNKLYNPDHPLGDIVFQAESYIRDPETLKTIMALPFREQAAICELLFGLLMKQCCFISLKDKHEPSIDDLEMIPSISTIYPRTNSIDQLKAEFFNQNQNVNVNPMFGIQRTPHMAAIFQAIDGKRTTRKVIDEAIRLTKTHASVEQVFTEFKRVVDILIKTGVMYLRGAGLKQNPSISEMEMRMQSLYGVPVCQEALELYHAQRKGS